MAIDKEDGGFEESNSAKCVDNPPGRLNLDIKSTLTYSGCELEDVSEEPRLNFICSQKNLMTAIKARGHLTDFSDIRIYRDPEF